MKNVLLWSLSLNLITDRSRYHSVELIKFTHIDQIIK